MYVFNEYQKNVIISACSNHWRSYLSLKDPPIHQVSNVYRSYIDNQNYLDGVADALGISICPEPGTLDGRYHIYTRKIIRDNNNNRIEVMTVDACLGKIIYDINTGDSKYSKEILKILKENIK